MPTKVSATTNTATSAIVGTWATGIHRGVKVKARPRIKPPLESVDTLQRQRQHSRIHLALQSEWRFPDRSKRGISPLGCCLTFLTRNGSLALYRESFVVANGHESPRVPRLRHTSKKKQSIEVCYFDRGATVSFRLGTFVRTCGSVHEAWCGLAHFFINYTNRTHTASSSPTRCPNQTPAP